MRNRGILFVAALALTACPTNNKCTTNADCTGGLVCSPMSGTCVANTGLGGGFGGGGGGVTGGGGGSTTGGGGGSTTGGGGGSTTGGGGGTTTDGGMANETCELAETITGTTFTGTTIGAANDYTLARNAAGTGCNGYAGHPGADVVYKISVPARSRVSLTLTAMTGNGMSMATPAYDPATYLVELPASNCSVAGTGADGGVTTEARCVASSPDPLDAAEDILLPETVSYTNSTANAVELLYVVESGWDGVNEVDTGVFATSEGNFSVTVTTTALPTPPANDTCASARTLPTTGTPLATETTAGASSDLTFDSASTTCTDTAGLPDVVYSVLVPAGQRLTVSATTPTMMAAIGFNIFEGACSAVSTCKTAVSQTTGTAATTRFDNTTGADKTVLIGVATAEASEIGTTFSISATLAQIPPPPANDTCTGAITLANATATPGTTVGALADLSFATSAMGCIRTTGDGDVYYTAMVQPGQRLTVSASTPTDEITLNVFEGACSMVAACKSGSSSMGGTPAIAKYDNTGTAAIPVVIQVSTFDSAQNGAAFSITATSGAIPPPPANDACASPTVLTANMLTNGTTSSAMSSMLFGTGASTTCSGTSTLKRDVFYSLVIPAMKTATITVTPQAGLDTLINVIEPVTMCSGVTACIADDDTGFGGEADVATYANTTAADKTVLLQIAAWSNNEGDFTINAVIP